MLILAQGQSFKLIYQMIAHKSAIGKIDKIHSIRVGKQESI